MFHNTDFMVDFVGIYFALIVTSFLFLIEQILLLIIVHKDKSGWKIRFSRIPNYPNLRPIQATWKIAVIIFMISLVFVPIAGIMFSDSLVNYAKSLQYGFLALFSLLIGAFFFIWHYLVGKEWNVAQVFLIILEFLILAILVAINYVR
jgi:hypothetical protein